MLLLIAIGWSLFFGLRSKSRIVRLWVLRGLALLVLLGMMLLPQKRREEVTVLRTQLAVLIDTSESMVDPADDRQPRRAERVKEWLDSPPLRKAAKDFDIRVFTFDSRITERGADIGDLPNNGAISNVISSLTEVAGRFRGQPLAGILLLSDGLDTSGASDAESLSFPRPVYTFELEKPFEKKESPKRVSIANVDHPQRVVVGWDSEIRVRVVATGMAGRTVPVELWRDGAKAHETAVAFNEEEQTREAVFPTSQDKPGMVQYEVRIVHPAADREAGNHPFLIEVIPPGKRVVYLQNALGFDFKYLKRAITSNRNLQLAAYVRFPDNRIVALGEAGTRARQTTIDFSQQTLSSFSVVILGDLPPDALSGPQWRAIHDFVDRGGGLVLLGGPNMLGSPAFASTPLGELLPVKIGAGTEYREGNFPVEITDTGLRHPVFGPLFSKVREFPGLLTVDLCEGVAPTAEVLMHVRVNDREAPLIASVRFGDGRVVAVMTDTIWRWRLAAGGWARDKSPYDTFWTQLMDWLIPKEQKREGGQRVELFTERSNFILGERPEVRAIVNVDPPTAKPPGTLPLEIRTPDGKTFNYTMHPATFQASDGREVLGYRSEVDPHVAGVFNGLTKFTLGGAKLEAATRFVVTRPPTELTGRPIHRDLLQAIASKSGGKFYAMADWNQWPKDLHFEEQQFSRTRLLDLWNHPALLGLFLCMLAMDWVLRKKWNLP